RRSTKSSQRAPGIATYISSSPMVVNVRFPLQPKETVTTSVLADAGRMAQLGRLVAGTDPCEAIPAFSAASNTSVACAAFTDNSTTSALKASLVAGAYATAAGARSSVGISATSAASR